MVPKIPTILKKVWLHCGATLFVLILSGFTSVQAQDSLLALKFSGLDVKLNSVGGLGWEGSPAIEFPSGSGKFPLNRLNFWVTGIKSNGDTLAVAADIFSKAGNWAEGPYGTDSYHHLNRKTWPVFSQVSALQIKTHQNSWKSGIYTMPVSIQKWPAAVNFTGFPVVCAPYADDNQNGYYDPAGGDYPYVPGNQNVFVMGSDSAGKSSLKKHQTGLDLSVVWFDPVKADSAPLTVFYRLTLCNRNPDTFNQLKISALADFAIGSPIDDQLATHVGLNTIYSYNQPGGDAVYGSQWPAVAVGWLSSAASASIYILPDNSAVQGKPANEREFYNYANGLWRSGKNMGSSGSGLDASSSTSKFIYPGVTDPSLPKGRNWTNSEGNAGRQTALISSGSMILNGKTCKVTDGFITVIPSAPDSSLVEKKLKQIHRLYNGAGFTLSSKEVQSNFNRVFPNPINTGNLLHINAPDGTKIKLLDLTGRSLREYEVENSAIRICEKPGTYFVLIPGKPGIKIEVF